MDEAAIKFLLESDGQKIVDKSVTQDSRYTEYILTNEKKPSVAENAALGPSWYKQKNLSLSGCGERKIHFRKTLKI